jgi:exopolysaccharide production protein ExoQ
MPPTIAAVVYVFVILGLFWLDRKQKTGTSAALWIPVVWMSIACTRTVGGWLHIQIPEKPDEFLDGSPVDRWVYSSLVLIGIIVLVSRRRQVGRFLRRNSAILLFLLYCLVSLLWSDYPSVAFKRWIKSVGDVVAVFVVLSERAPFVAMERLLARLTYVLIPVSVLFVKYYPGLGRDYGPWGGSATYMGVATSKNTLGAICLCFGLGALWRFLSAYRAKGLTGRFRQMIVQCVILTMVLWLLLVSNALSSTVSFLMASVLLLAMDTRMVKHNPVIVHVLMIAMLAASVAVVSLGLSPSALRAIGRDPTLTGRTEIWGTVLSEVRNPLLGTGFESFWLGPRLERIWNLYWFHPQQAHNGYLEIFLNLGWVGVVLLIIVIATAYRTAFGSWRRNDPMGSLRLAFFFIGLVVNLTEAAFFRMQAPAWLFFLLGIVSVPAVSYREKSRMPVHNWHQASEPVSREWEQPTLSTNVIFG